MLLGKEEGATDANYLRVSANHTRVSASKDKRPNKWVCYNCGGNHGKMKCAKGPQTCGKCGRQGHIAKISQCLGGPIDDDDEPGDDDDAESTTPTRKSNAKKAVSANNTLIQQG